MSAGQLAFLACVLLLKKETDDSKCVALNYGEKSCTTTSLCVAIRLGLLYVSLFMLKTSIHIIREGWHGFRLHLSYSIILLITVHVGYDQKTYY